MVFSSITSLLDLVPMKRLPRTSRCDFGDEILGRGEVVIRTKLHVLVFYMPSECFEVHHNNGALVKARWDRCYCNMGYLIV